MDYVERTEIIQIILSFVNHKPIMRNLINKIKNYLPYLGLHNAHGLENLQKKLVRVYNAHGLLKKMVVGNVRIKYQSYIFFSPLSMFHLLGEFKNHLSLFIFNKVAKY